MKVGSMIAGVVALGLMGIGASAGAAVFSDDLEAETAGLNVGLSSG
jgi:peptidase E